MEILDIKEQDDGSATLTVDLTEEETRQILAYGIQQLLVYASIQTLAEES